MIIECRHTITWEIIPSFYVLSFDYRVTVATPVLLLSFTFILSVSFVQLKQRVFPSLTVLLVRRFNDFDNLSSTRAFT